MESSFKIKNVLILILFFSLGVITGVVSTVGNKEDIRLVLENLRSEENIQVAVVEEEPEEEVISEEIVDLCPLRVEISGAVKNAGVYCLPQDSALVDVIKMAGGFVNQVAQKYVSMRINLASLLIDNSKIYIPYEEDSVCEILEFKLPKEVVNIIEPKPSENPSDKEGACISINSATLEQLQTLNGVGPSTAQKIINGRPYEKEEDLLNVSGIGQATYEKFQKDICL